MENLDYNVAAEIINSLSYSEKSDPIDISSALINNENISEYDYNNALKILDSIISTQEDKKSDTYMEKRLQNVTFIKDIVKDAEKELSSAIVDIEKNVAEDVGEINMPSIKRKNMVLVTLSIEDQIDELEKISVGLDENSFNKEQFEVIHEEVSELYKFVKAKKATQITGDAAIRNQRLEEVLTKIDSSIKGKR